MDFTMCCNDTCPSRTHCYRNPASGTAPDEYQSWADFKPCVECEYYEYKEPTHDPR